ncbi:MAG: radical SAM protein [Peptococcaceae bacterium]|nr:radical SAM protein [Peptococcaceae bacterium]
MRVLLIQPPNPNRYMERLNQHEPLALEYLGAALNQDNHEVFLLDARLEPDYEGAFRSFRPDVVGLNGFTPHLNIVRRMAAGVKALDPKVCVIVGGHHATVRAEDYNCEQVDLVVRGEGVAAIREIMKCLEAGSSFEKIPGLGLPGKEMFLTDPRPHPALDSLPFPDRALTAKCRHAYFSEWLRPLASIRTSLGCVSRCSFCALWGITDGRYLYRQPAKIVEELKAIGEEHVFFCDDESMCDWRRMDQLADFIREAGIRKKYYLYARVDTIVKYPGIFAKWKEIGLAQAFIGFESFTDERLKGMKKGITVEQQQEAARIFHDLGIDIYGSFIVDPSFTRKDFADLASYIRRIQTTFTSIGILTPLPGTELYREKVNELTTHQPESYDLVHAVLPTALPLAEFYSEYLKLYRRATPLPRFLHAAGKLKRGHKLAALRDFMYAGSELKRSIFETLR